MKVPDVNMSSFMLKNLFLYLLEFGRIFLLLAAFSNMLYRHIGIRHLSHYMTYTFFPFHCMCCCFFFSQQVIIEIIIPKRSAKTPMFYRKIIFRSLLGMVVLNSSSSTLPPQLINCCNHWSSPQSFSFQRSP